MHSFLNFSNPAISTLLWVQIVGMPIAFLVRATVLIVRAFREPSENRQKHIIRAVSNVLFAASCWSFGIERSLAILCFASGIGLSIWAFIIAREQTNRNAAMNATPVRIVQRSPKVRSGRNGRSPRLRRSSS